MIRVRIPPTLRTEVGGVREVEASGGTLREVLGDLADRFPGLGNQVLEDGDGIAPFVNVYLDSEDVRTLQGLDTPVREGSTVILLPAMAGGERTLTPSLLETIGDTPLVELPRLAPNPGVRLYAKLEGQNPTGSIKDRVAKAMIETAEASGELEPGRELLEPTSGNTGISLAMVAKLKGYPLTCVLPENATSERVKLLELYGAKLVFSPASEGSNGAVRHALRLAERDPRLFMPFQYANEANPRAHYEGTGAEIADALPHVDALVAGLGTGGTLMGAGDRLRENNPDLVVAAAEPLQGDLVYGLRSLADGYVPPILDLAKLDRKVLVTNEESVEACACCSTARRSSPASRRAPSCTWRARSPRSSRRASSSRCSPTAAGSTSPPTSGPARGRGRGVHGGPRLVVIPAEVRSALVEHAEAELPNEACGLISLRNDGVAERFVPGRNRSAEPLQIRARDRSGGLVSGGRGLRAGGLPLPPVLAAAPVADGRREHRALGGPPLRDPLAPHRRGKVSGGVDDRGTAPSTACRSRRLREPFRRLAGQMGMRTISLLRSRAGCPRARRLRRLGGRRSGRSRHPAFPWTSGLGAGPGISIEEAIAADTDEMLLVNGNLLADGDEVRLCYALAGVLPAPVRRAVARRRRDQARRGRRAHHGGRR